MAAGAMPPLEGEGRLCRIRRGVRRDFGALEKRRFAAIRLFKKGLNQVDIARRLNVVRLTVAGRSGREPLLSAEDRRWLEKLLLGGSLGWSPQ